MFAEIHHSSQAGLCVFSMLASVQAASRPSPLTLVAKLTLE